MTCRPVAPIGRAADSKSACCGFESLLACHFFFSTTGLILAVNHVAGPRAVKHLQKVAAEWVFLRVVKALGILMGSLGRILALTPAGPRGIVD